MAPTAVENVERWRKTVLDGASDEVQSYFESLETSAQENILFEAILAVADVTDKEKLRDMRGNNVSVEACLLDDFMLEQADEAFMSRVASMVVVGIRKIQSREINPLENTNEDIELLLTLLVNAPDSTKEMIRNLTPEQANDTIKTLHGSIASRVSNETSRKLAAHHGVDMAKSVLCMIAKNEGLCRKLFSEKNCKKIQFSKPAVDESLKE